jgi:1-acyl-sn-glycerol-3-phosphate acyltransferase
MISASESYDARVQPMRPANGEEADRFRPSLIGAVQARVIRRLITLVGKGILRLHVEVAGLEHVPRGEPLIVAAAPHRNWVDTFLLLMVLPPLPRVYFLGSAQQTQHQVWRRVLLRLTGGFVPVSTIGQINRESLQTSLAILGAGNSIGIYPEGWENVDEAPAEVRPLKRGVAFLSEHSGRRVLPVGIAGTMEWWRGKTVRLRIAPPLAALPPGADRTEEQAYVDLLRETLQQTLPPLPVEPVSGRKPWRWLTKML